MNDFKVMPWLRALRDRHAEEEKKLSLEKRLEKHRFESEPLMREFFKHHPESRKQPKEAHALVAEERLPYGKKSRS